MKYLNAILEKLRNKYNKETENGIGIYIMKELTSTITCSTLFMTSKEYIDNDLFDCDPNVLDICTFGLEPSKRLEPSKVLSNTSLNSISDNKSLIIHEYMTINSDNRIIRPMSPSNSISSILTTTDICKYNISYDNLDMNLLEIIPNLDKLELLYKEIHNSLNKNLSIQAYSLFMKLTYLLLEVLEKLEYIGYKVKIEIELLINNGEKIGNEVFNNTQSQQGTHSFLKRIQNRNNLGSISNNKNIIELVELTQSGIPFKSVNNNYQHNNSKRWRINQKSSDNNININTSKSKIYLEPYPLFPKILNKKKRSCKLNLEPNSNYNFDTYSRFYKLEEFPCIIFSYNCQSIYNKCFADSSHRNLALEYIKFPTKVNCIGLGNNNPLANFIKQIVTDMHLHRLRFTIFKCSESYRGLISALRIRQSYSKTNNNEQEDHNFLQNKSNNSSEISDDESDIYNELYKGNQNPEWNTLDDSNIGMWWAMDSNSEFKVLCDFTVDTNVVNVISIVNESNLHSHWAPFVTNSECISYIGLYSQLISHSSSLPWPIGLCQCSLYCVAVDICRSSNNQPCVIITAVSFPDKADSACGIKTKDQPNNVSKLDILSLCFVIQPFGGNNLKTRISFISKSLIPIPSFVPKAVPSFIAKQIGKCLFNNLMRIIRNFESSPFYERILDDVEFYEFVRNRLNINSESGVINNINNPIFDINLNYKDINYFNKDEDKSYISVTMNILHTSYSMETSDEDIAYTPGVLNSKDILKDTFDNTLDPQISKVIGYLFPNF